MIIKSLILLSILFNVIGMDQVSDKIDQSIVRQDMGGGHIVSASDSIINSLPEILPRPKINSNAIKPAIYSKNYLLADPDSGIVFLKQEHKSRVPIASTTKIMTAIVVLENYELDDIATISSTAANQIGADAFLMTGEKITIESLLNCLLIKSGNDSAYARAEHMNQDGEIGIEAAELGMRDTNYRDPAGLNTTGYSSAFDLYLATKYALKNPVFKEIVNKDKEVVTSIDKRYYHELNNSNRLVNEYQYPGAIGVKTGYMPEAGHCLVGATDRNGKKLISVILNTYADTPSASADESRKILDWGYANINW